MGIEVNGQYSSLANIQGLKAKEQIKAPDSPVASAVKQICNMGPCSDPQELAVNVIKFMNKNIKFAGDVNGARNRDACQWSGEKVIEEGNFNGCVEAVKAFKALFTEAAKAKGFSAKCEYVSSFNVSWATPDNVNNNISDPPGHAMAKLTTNKGSYLLDATRFGDPIFGSNLTDQDLSNPVDIAPAKKGRIIQNEAADTDTFIEKTPTGYKATTYSYGNVFNESKKVGDIDFSSLAQLNQYLNGAAKTTTEDLVKNGIIKQADQNGIYYMDIGKGPEPYKLFGNTEFKIQKNPYNIFDPSTSNGATRTAMREYINPK
jgi:hypothetical protein